MRRYVTKNYLRKSFLVFAGIPLLVWSVGKFPERALLQESISVMTMLAFFQMLSLFFWSRSNTAAVKEMPMRRTVKIHKAMGYTCTAIMLLHPVLLVVPRFFEAGVSPDAALLKIITTFNRGVLLGMLAWSLLLTIGLTAFARTRLPVAYRTWRKLHGTLAALFVTSAAWHAIDLGRHSNLAMSILIILLTAGSIRLLLRNTFPSKSEQSRTAR